MSLRRRVLSGAASLGAGQVVSQGLSFVRNIIVARLLSPEDFGIAATFAITVSLLEMISDLAADKLIIQARDGDDPRLQSTAQLWQFIRGAASGLIIALLAWPIAAFFKVPQATWAFCWLGLVPVLRGLVHLDIRRLQREMHFWPAVASETAAQAAATAAAFPLAWWLRDYAAMLWIVILQAAVLALVSHLVARRTYRWSWDRAHAARLLEFGWPLLINGVLMFAIFQGDRLVVASAYSMRDLGLYSAAYALALAPTNFFAVLAGSVTLPLLAEVQDDGRRFVRRYQILSKALAAAAVVVAASFCILGGPLLGELFGSAYGAAEAVLIPLALAQAIRVVRVAPTIAALAHGDSRSSLYANLSRVLVIPVMITVGVQGYAVSIVAGTAIVGETLALILAAERLRRWHSTPAWPTWRTPLVAFIGLFGCAFGVHQIECSLWVDFLLLAAVVLAAATMFLLSSDVQEEVRRALTHFQKRCSTEAVAGR